MMLEKGVTVINEGIDQTMQGQLYSFPRGACMGGEKPENLERAVMLMMKHATEGSYDYC